MNKKSIKDVDVAGKRVIVRVDFNVPLNKEGQITDDARITGALPTIKYILDQKPRVLILMSHLGRPKGEVKPEFSLKPVAEYLNKSIPGGVKLLADCIGDEVKKAVSQAADGAVILLENVRFHKAETKNDPIFAKSLAELADVYVNDAFGSAHRAHASTEGITKYLPAVAGFLLAKEIEFFDKVLSNPERPFVAILGGAKVSDKITVIENLLEKVNTLLIGGGMAYTFLKTQGHTIGNSKLDAESLAIAQTLLVKAKEKNVTLLLPQDHVVGNEFSEQAQAKGADIDIEDGWMGLDIGPKTVAAFKEVIKGAKTIVWNGPLGVFEFEKFKGGSEAIAQCIAASSAMSIIGGGDTAAAIKAFGLEDKMSHISTGGGASLEYLEGKMLPGIAALNDK
ncbi:MAG: phosphoglycerate kinase [Candidatus Omnitrophota bacterium]